MKIGTGLRERADAKTKIQNLNDRVQSSAVIHAGVQPERNAEELLHQLSRYFDLQADLIVQINLTNNITHLPNGMTLMESIVRRDMLTKKVTQVRQTLEWARRAVNQERRNVAANAAAAAPTSAINVFEWEQRCDAWAEEARQLNEHIQELNALTQLVELP